MRRNESLMFWASSIFLLLVIFSIVISEKISDHSPSNEDYYNDSNENYTIISEENIGDDFSYASELHWDHMPVTFSFAKQNIRESNINCQDYQIKRVRQAFKIIENETNGIVFFNEIEEGGDIITYCNSAKADSDLLMRMGDGLYESYGNIITKGELNFYLHRNCGTWPDMEIHEILHVFGYGHIEDSWSIMNPLQVRCDLGKVDNKIVSCLKDVYSNGEQGEGCSEVSFGKAEDFCEEDWYHVKNTNYCCPEPNMIIDEDGYCV